MSTPLSRVRRLLGALSTCLLLGAPALAAERAALRIASLEWPPYTGEALPDGGTMTARLRAACAEVDVQLEIEYLPWSRAVMAARTDPKLVGYFPEYESANLRRQWLLSEPLGISELGFAEPYDRPIVWRGADTLTPLRVGVVQDYVNTVALDARIASGEQPFERSVSDRINLLKLAHRRVDIAVVDRMVFAWLMANDPMLQPYRGELVINPHLLERKTLHVAFRPDSAGRRAAKLLAEGLRRLDAATPHR
ncbi:substrate-binding periplasmic protein [Niveibacterium sp.]|uniref:substrate-binding periplasmic protein n=1 Tax=Niveibacterium sp. TaxID=2017444 RepID=UPI0035B3E6C8